MMIGPKTAIPKIPYLSTLRSAFAQRSERGGFPFFSLRLRAHCLIRAGIGENHNGYQVSSRSGNNRCHGIEANKNSSRDNANGLKPWNCAGNEYAKKPELL